jgi:hypothetical protein
MFFHIVLVKSRFDPATMAAMFLFFSLQLAIFPFCSLNSPSITHRHAGPDTVGGR